MFWGLRGLLGVRVRGGFCWFEGGLWNSDEPKISDNFNNTLPAGKRIQDRRQQCSKPVE